MSGQNQPFSFPVDIVGTVRTITPSGGWQIGTVRIDNPSGMWLLLRPTLTYIPPNTLARVITIVPKTLTLQIEYVNAPIGGVVSAATGGPIDIQAFDDLLIDDVGVDYTLIPTIGALNTLLQTLINTLVITNQKLDILGASFIDITQVSLITLNLAAGATQIVPAVAGIRHVPLYFKFGATLEVVSANPIVDELRCQLFHGPGGGPFVGFHVMSINPDDPVDTDTFFPYGTKVPNIGDELQAQIFNNGGSNTGCYLEMIYYDTTV